MGLRKVNISVVSPLSSNDLSAVETIAGAGSEAAA